MASIFSRIAAGEIPSYKIAQDERFYAFLDINPRRKGHTLVIPKQEVDYLFHLDAETLGDLFRFAQRVAKAIEAVVPCNRIGVAVLGLEVPHAHIHLIPIDSERDMSFSRPVFKMTAEEMQQLAQRIADKFE